MRIAYMSCPLCGGISTFLGKADCTKHSMWHEPISPALEWMSCSECGHIHTRYYWTPAGLAEIFSHHHPNQVANSVNLPAKIQTWKPVVQAVVALRGGFREHLNHPAIWFDIGCGDGSLAMTAGEFAFKAAGLDARAQAVSALNSAGLRAFQGDFMEIEVSEPVNVLSMMDILEHIPYPCEALRKAYTLLADSSILVLSMPNTESNEWRIMDREHRNPYWIEIEHFHNFSASRLIALLEHTGFCVRDFTIPYGRYKAQMEIYAVKVSHYSHALST